MLDEKSTSYVPVLRWIEPVVPTLRTIVPAELSTAYFCAACATPGTASAATKIPIWSSLRHFRGLPSVRASICASPPPVGYVDTNKRRDSGPHPSCPRPHG